MTGDIDIFPALRTSEVLVMRVRRWTQTPQQARTLRHFLYQIRMIRVVSLASALANLLNCSSGGSQAGRPYSLSCARSRRYSMR